MEKHCTVVYYLLRKKRVDKNGESPIDIYIRVNTERKGFSTGKRVKQSEWDDERQIVKGKSDKAKQINEYLYQLRNKVFKKEIELMEKGYLLTPQLLKEAVCDKVEAIKNKTILDVFNDYINQKRNIIGIGISQNTFDNYELSGRYIKEYINNVYKRKDLYLHEIHIGFIEGFHSFLLSEKSNCQNTCAKHLKFLKQMMNIAVSNGYIQYNPLTLYKVEREPVEIDFLDDVELRKIINFETPIKRFERTRDAFLFGCFTGLAYIDIKTLRKEHFETDEDGRIWIKKKRVKTGVLSRIPLLPMAKLLLEKYQDWGGEAVMPIQDPTDINENLKDIAILCGINKHVTFHTSRHTFASTVTLANNISMEVIAKMMGHTNTRMTARYAKLVDKYIGEQMDKLVDTFTQKSE